MFYDASFHSLNKTEIYLSRTSDRYTLTIKPSAEEQKLLGNLKDFSESCHDLRFKIKDALTSNNRLSLVNRFKFSEEVNFGVPFTGFHSVGLEHGSSKVVESKLHV